MIIMKDIEKIYNKGRSNAFTALTGASLQILDGELVAIIGKSGAGKSTLLHIMACIDSFEDGTYQINDVAVECLREKDLAEIRNEYIGLVMQDFALVEDLTGIQNVMLPLDFSRIKRKNKKALAMQALENVGMESFAHKFVCQLSGGQKQRIAIARAIVNEPNIILADEPTGALDNKTSSEIMNLFKTLNCNGHTVIIVTHDVHIAEQCKRIIQIEDGKIV